MNWEALGAIGELASAVIVLASVAYLAVQIRQNTKQTRLASIQAINASNDSAFDPIYLAENTHIFTKGQASFSDLSEHEKVVFDMLMMRLAASFDSTTYQFVQGSYDEELYEGTLKFYATFVASPGGREWLNMRKESLTSITLANLERAIEEMHEGAT
ncbi:MAG: hypothetical protein V3T23_02990 [Nitrososphaerales archaeon]